MRGGHRLGLISTLGIAVGTTVGGGIFAFIVPAADHARGLLPLAFALAALPALFSLLPIAALAAAIPTRGGNYAYPSRLLSPRIAAFAVWTYAYGTFFGTLPLYALTCADTLRSLFPAFPTVPLALGLLSIGYLANVRGVRTAAFFEVAMVLTLLLALFGFVLLGWPHVRAENLAIRGPEGGSGVAAAASLLTFAYLGSNALIELGHEVRAPERTIPLAMLICLVAVAALYIGIAVVTVGVLPWGSLLEPSLVAVAKSFLGAMELKIFVLGGAFLALMTSLNAVFLWGTKSVQVLSKDGVLPSTWAKEHPRWGTPHRILTGAYGLSVLGLLLPMSPATLSAHATIGGLVILIPVQLSAMLLSKRCPKAFAASPLKLGPGVIQLGASIGVLLSLGALVTVGFDLRDPLPLTLFLAWTLAGLGWAFRRAPRSLPPDPEWS